MDGVKTLVRTVARSFFSNPKQILIIDALLIHSVLNVEDIASLLTSQQKEIRKLLAPLRQAQLIHSQTKSEIKLGQNRPSNRDYYYINFRHAVDAINYRITALMDKVQDLYKRKENRKEWRCPRCKSEYEAMDVLRYQSATGFSCEKCGYELEQTPQAKSAANMIGHEKHSALMDQLSAINSLLQQVSRQPVPQNEFDTAWAKKKDVPKKDGQNTRAEYIPAANIKTAKSGHTGPETIKAESLGIVLTTGAEHSAEDQRQREKRKAELALQNQLPVWHTSSTVDEVKKGTKAEPGDSLKAEDEDEKKPIANEDGEDGVDDDEMAEYVREMQRERAEAARKAAEEDLSSEDDDESVGVPSTIASTPRHTGSTPASLSQPPNSLPRTNGLKRQYDFDSPASSDANTPAAATPSADGSDREAKRVKRTPPKSALAVKAEEDDEDDFEDAM